MSEERFIGKISPRAFAMFPAAFGCELWQIDHLTPEQEIWLRERELEDLKMRHEVAGINAQIALNRAKTR